MRMTKTRGLTYDESLFSIMDGVRSVDAPPAKALTSATARAARLGVEPRVGSQSAKILAYIRSRGDAGAADFEGIRDLRAAIPTIENAYRDRRGRLAKKGLIELAYGVTRLSPAGQQCEVWRAKKG